MYPPFPLRAAALALGVALTACSDDGTPTRSKADLLTGTWYLQATEGNSEVAALVDVSYTLTADGGARQRIGGEFLRALREMEVVSQALQGQEQLGDVDRIDGANLNWIGRWVVSADTLQVSFDHLVVEAFGDVPILGKVTLPVVEQALTPSSSTQIDYLCQLQDEVLTLRGAMTVGIGPDGEPQSLTGRIDDPAGEVAQRAAGLLADQLRGLDTQRYVRR